MKAFGLFLFLLVSVATVGCTTSVHFPPHASTSKPFELPVSLGVYYTTGTLARVDTYENKNASYFRKWEVHVGEALEKEAFSRLRPRVEHFFLSESPYPNEDMEFVLTLGIKEFEWQNVRAETILTAVLRGPAGSVLLDKSYRGTGSAQLSRVSAKEVNAAQGVGETTREAMVAALSQVLTDAMPYLESHANAKPEP